MGRIKQAMVKKTAHTLMQVEGNKFSEDFDNNKKVLGNTMPSKKVRNKIAGYISRLVKYKNKENKPKA